MNGLSEFSGRPWWRGSVMMLKMWLAVSGSASRRDAWLAGWMLLLVSSELDEGGWTRRRKMRLSE
eukprot:162336-Hanusia_phi.AAC.1